MRFDKSLQKTWEILKKEPVCDTLIELYQALFYLRVIVLQRMRRSNNMGKDLKGKQAWPLARCHSENKAFLRR